MVARAAFHAICPTSSCRQQSGRANPGKSGGIVSAREENGRMRLCWKKRFESGGSIERSNAGSVSLPCRRVAEDHGSSIYSRQRSSTVRCSELDETPRGGEERNNRRSERSSRGRERIDETLDEILGGGEERNNRNSGRSSLGRERIDETTLDEVLGGAEERNNRSSERSSQGRERLSSNKGQGGVAAAGKVLEVRLLQRLNRTLTDRHLLRPGQNVLLAVSGGQDSVCLMYLLVKLQSKWGWKIGIAHCDHQWSSSARKQAAHVAQMAQGLGLDYYQALTTEAVPGEGAARTWRYGALQRIAVCHGYETIVTAHTASDRIETLLFNIFRGTGLQGLQSLTWKRLLSPQLSLSRKSAFQVTNPIESVEDPHYGTIAISKGNISLVRPLLDVTRTELRGLLQELELPLWPDPTNLSLDIDRNRIRHQLLPYLRKHFNSGVDRSLARWAEILHGEQVYLDTLCESIRLNAESEFTGPGAVAGGRKLDVSLLRALPIALQRRILKQFADSFTGKSLGFDTVERVRQACAEASSAKKGLQISVPGGYYLRFCGTDLIVARCPGK